MMMLKVNVISDRQRREAAGAGPANRGAEDDGDQEKAEQGPRS